MRPKVFALVAALMICCPIYGDEASTTAKPANRAPNTGFVANEQAALDIARYVLSHTLSPEDLSKKVIFSGVVSNGVWTVYYSEPKTRINFPVKIQIRQKTGGIMKYEDPNA